jgi:hypothetical protein
MPYNPNSARTQFKKGRRSMNMYFSAHERVNGDGYVEISVAEKNPHMDLPRQRAAGGSHARIASVPFLAPAPC